MLVKCTVVFATVVVMTIALCLAVSHVINQLGTVYVIAPQ